MLSKNRKIWFTTKDFFTEQQINVYVYVFFKGKNIKQLNEHSPGRRKKGN